MNIISIVVIAIGLSMDAFSVSVTNGFIIKEIKFKHAFRISIFFGIFQAIMPVIGWASGTVFRSYIKAYDHWIAFGLLMFIGAKMIYESKIIKEEADKKTCLHFPTLLILSVATSIDALAVGLTYAFLDINIILPSIIIGLITFVICLAGVYIGNKVGHFFENKLELIGGIILILIGFKILMEHTVFS